MLSETVVVNGPRTGEQKLRNQSPVKCNSTMEGCLVVIVGFNWRTRVKRAGNRRVGRGHVEQVVFNGQKIDDSQASK